MASESPIIDRADTGPVFFRALRGTLGRTPLWVTTSALTSLMALAVALPWYGWFDSTLGSRYEPGSLLHSLDETFRFDHRAGLAALNDQAAATGAVMALLAMLLGAFTAGGWLQVFLERTKGHSVRRFFFGGSRYFFRFLRVLVLTLLTLQLAGYVLYGAPWDWLVNGTLLGLPEGDLDLLPSEATARYVGFAQDGLFLLTVALVFVWGDYTRTRLALHDGSSAVWSGLCSWVLIGAHPIRVLRPVILLWTTEVIVLSGAWWLTERLNEGIGPGSGWQAIFMLFVVGQVALAWRCVVRGARYAAALQVSSQLVRPPARPDPWRKSIGGPGGPRYPIGGDEADEYGVSL